MMVSFFNVCSLDTYTRCCVYIAYPCSLFLWYGIWETYMRCKRNGLYFRKKHTPSKGLVNVITVHHFPRTVWVEVIEVISIVRAVILKQMLILHKYCGCFDFERDKRALNDLCNPMPTLSTLYHTIYTTGMGRLRVYTLFCLYALHNSSHMEICVRLRKGFVLKLWVLGTFRYFEIMILSNMQIWSWFEKNGWSSGCFRIEPILNRVYPYLSLNICNRYLKHGT